MKKGPCLLFAAAALTVIAGVAHSQQCQKPGTTECRSSTASGVCREWKCEQVGSHKKMVLTGILSIQHGESPTIVRQKLEGYLMEIK